MSSPISTRRNDVKATQDAGSQPFLNQIQLGQPIKYALYGDKVFRLFDDDVSCIKTYHHPDAFIELTNEQEHANKLIESHDLIGRMGTRRNPLGTTNDGCGRRSGYVRIPSLH